MFQSDWSLAFWPETHESHFFQIWDLPWYTQNNKKFPYKLDPEKSKRQNFSKPYKSYFGPPILSSFCGKPEFSLKIYYDQFFLNSS